MENTVIQHSYGSIDATWAASKFSKEEDFVKWGQANYANKPFFAKMVSANRETWLKGIWKQIKEATTVTTAKGDK